MRPGIMALGAILVFLGLFLLIFGSELVGITSETGGSSSHLINVGYDDYRDTKQNIQNYGLISCVLGFVVAAIGGAVPNKKKGM